MDWFSCHVLPMVFLCPFVWGNPSTPLRLSYLRSLDWKRKNNTQICDLKSTRKGSRKFRLTILGFIIQRLRCRFDFRHVLMENFASFSCRLLVSFGKRLASTGTRLTEHRNTRNSNVSNLIFWTSTTDMSYDRLGLKKWSVLIGSLAQLVEHCTGIAEVIGSNPIPA